MEEKIARICWNTMSWQQPSGIKGKSKATASYERKIGFGHEEWLLDKSTIINGYHYAFLQPINKGYTNHIGSKYKIHLYTINPSMQRLYLGFINDVEVVSQEESNKIYSYYLKKGWIEEMKKEVISVDGKPTDLDKNWIFNVKFKFSDANIDLSKVRVISSYLAPRYVLMDLKTKFLFEKDKEGDFHYLNINTFLKTNKSGTSIVDPMHKKIQNNVCRHLKNIYKLRLEVPTDYGNNRIDIIGETKDIKQEYHYFEVKTKSALLCIREGLGQILEYNNYPSTTHASKLFIVGPDEPQKGDIEYLNFLRGQYHIPLWYLWYNFSDDSLSKPY